MANTIPANNNTGLYNTVTGNATPINANVYATNVFASGFVSATGNIYTSGFYFGDGSQLTNLPPSPSSYGNSNVTTLLAGFGSNTVSTTGNISAGYFVGNGSLLTGVVTSSYGNSNVAAFLPTYTGDLAGANLSVTGNITGGNLNVSGNISDSTGALQINSVGNINLVPTSTVTVAGAVSTTGNITGAYILGNGSQLTGLPATYGNSNVSIYLASGTNSNNIITGGNVQGGNLITSGAAGNIVGANYVSASYFVGDGSLLTNVTATSSYSNSNVTSLMASFGSNTISTTGNISSGYLFGNGSQLTGIATSTYGNSNVNTLLAAWGSNSLSTTGTINSGNITGGNILTGGLISATGNVTGAYIFGNGSQLTGIATSSYGNSNVAAFLGNFGSNNIVTDGNITMTSAGAGGYLSVAQTATVGALLSNTTIGGASLSVGGNVTAANVVATNNLSATGNVRSSGMVATGNVTASYFLGNGSALSSLTGANVTGTVANATYATTSGSATTAGTVTTAAQPNITSLGTLSSLSVTGNIVTGGILTDGYYYANGTPFSGGGGSTYGNSNVNTLLAAWGSNSLSTTGNVTVTNLVTSNILMTGQISNPIGDNIAIENITTGLISATGNVTAAYFIGNGSLLTGGYGNANVATFLNDFGSNSIITTGNIGNVASKVGTGFFNAVATDNISSPTGDFVTIENVSTTAISATGNISASNLNLSGQIYDSTGVLQLNGSGNIVLVPIGSTQAYGPVNIIGGKLTADAVTYANADGTAGQVLTTYGNGVTYFSTPSSGGSPGGANTQIQFNDAGAFAGNAAMTFNNTTGTITLGNITTNTNTIQTVGAVDLANANAFGTTTPWRIQLGNAYNGSANSIYSSTSAGTLSSALNAPRLLVADFVTVPNTGLRFQEQTNYVWANLSANISNTSTRIASQRNEITVGGGTSNYTITATNTASMILSTSNQINLGGGTNANLSLVGNITTTAGAMGSFNGVTVNNYSTANIIVGQQTNLTTNNANTTAFGNATTQIGHFMNFGGAPANANITGTTTAIGYYMPGFTQVIPGITATNGNIARQATNYYSFRSDDTLAKAQLGSLSSFNEFQYNLTSSAGAVTINKANAQVQYLLLTEAITSMTFSNFVNLVVKPNATSAFQTDTVTLIISQGATPYAVTMPSGAAYKYAGGVSVVGTTANSTTMISITAITPAAGSGTEYLITISPEFV